MPSKKRKHRTASESKGQWPKPEKILQRKPNPHFDIHELGRQAP